MNCQFLEEEERKKYLMRMINNVIKQCKSIEQLRQVHAHTITAGLLALHHPSLFLHTFTIFLTQAAAAAAAATTTANTTSSLLAYSLSLFNSIPNPSTFSYNNLIRVHTLLFSPLPALLFFSQMRRLSIPPDFHTFPFAFKACAQLRLLSLAQSLHSQAFKFGFAADLFVLNSLISVYSVSGSVKYAYQVFSESSHRDVVSYNAAIDGLFKAGDIHTARQLFDKMPVRDSVSWGTLIAGYTQMKQWKEAIELFNEMIALGICPDNVALVSVLSACSQLGELEQGKIVHNFITQNRITVETFLSTALVDMYAKCGSIETAMEMFESCQSKNLFTWNAMLGGLAMHGKGEKTLDYLKRMKRGGVEADGVSILGVLVACSHAGLVKEAWGVFKEMEFVYGVGRELKHYGCMADLLGRAGLIREAMEMTKRMPMEGDVFVWGGLLGGCRIHGNVEIAEKAAKQVMELNPGDGGVYSIMAQVYATAQRWEDVVKIRRLMDGNKMVKKKAGCSLIQLNGVTHEFVAGDTLHPQTDNIYMILNAVGKHQFHQAC